VSRDDGAAVAAVADGILACIIAFATEKRIYDSILQAIELLTQILLGNKMLLMRIFLIVMEIS
jgi:hypothetical protein